MIALTFEQYFSANDILLTEGSVFERLRRNPLVTFDENLAHAALVYDQKSAAALAEIHHEYFRIAANAGLPMMAFTDTWRASAERIACSRFCGRNVNADCASLLCNVRERYSSVTPIFVGGLIGCRGDAYKPAEALDKDAAFDFHAPQIEALGDTNVDFLFAATLPAVTEARGIALRMAATSKPYIISFVIRPDGTVLDGTPLGQAIDLIDQESINPPLAYCINCVHPTVLLSALDNGPFNRLIGIQGNTSKKCPEELDGFECLDTQEPAEFAQDMWHAVKKGNLQICGGCCGTDARHISALAQLIVAERKNGLR